MTYIRHYDDDADNDDDTNEYCNTATATRVHLCVAGAEVVVAVLCAVVAGVVGFFFIGMPGALV